MVSIGLAVDIRSSSKPELSQSVLEGSNQFGDNFAEALDESASVPGFA